MTYLGGADAVEAADGAALGVAARVAARGHDHRDRHFVRPLQLHVCEFALTGSLQTNHKAV